MVRRTTLTAPASQSGRTGVAPLELVMLLPLIAGLIYGLFTLSRATLTRLDVVREARNQAWAVRERTGTQQQMILESPRLDGLAAHDASKIFQADGWWRGSYSAESRSRTLAGSWDHKEVPFTTAATPFLAHTHPASLIASQARLQILAETVLPAMAMLLNIPANPVLIVPIFASEHAMPAVEGASKVLRSLRFPIRVLRESVLFARRIARWLFQRSLARYLGKLASLMDHGLHAIDQLHNASRQHKIDWPRGGYDVWGLFP